MICVEHSLQNQYISLSLFLTLLKSLLKCTLPVKVEMNSLLSSPHTIHTASDHHVSLTLRHGKNQIEIDSRNLVHKASSQWDLLPPPAVYKFSSGAEDIRQDVHGDLTWTSGDMGPSSISLQLLSHFHDEGLHCPLCIPVQMSTWAGMAWGRTHLWISRGGGLSGSFSVGPGRLSNYSSSGWCLCAHSFLYSLFSPPEWCMLGGGSKMNACPHLVSIPHTFHRLC